MFVCEDCKHDLNLTQKGRDWHWPNSLGECEMCEEFDDCQDVSCQYDWAWNDKFNNDLNL